MKKHKELWEIPRSKVLQNLLIIMTNLEVGAEDIEGERHLVRKVIIQNIMEWLGCNKRTAYDYLVTLENMPCLPTSVMNVIIGGKRDVNRRDI